MSTPILILFGGFTLCHPSQPLDKYLTMYPWFIWSLLILLAWPNLCGVQYAFYIIPPWPKSYPTSSLVLSECCWLIPMLVFHYTPFKGGPNPPTQWPSLELYTYLLYFQVSHSSVGFFALSNVVFKYHTFTTKRKEFVTLSSVVLKCHTLTTMGKSFVMFPRHVRRTPITWRPKYDPLPLS